MSMTMTLLPDDGDRDPMGALFGLEDIPGLSGGVIAAYGHAPEEWRAAAETALLDCIAAGEPFDVDDIRARGVGDPDKQQRWAALFAFARNRGWIELEALTIRRPAKGDARPARVWVPGTCAPRVRGEAA